MKKITLLIALSTFFISTAQQSKIDSLIQTLEFQKNIEPKIDIISQLTNLLNSSSKRFKYYSDELCKLASEHNSEKADYFCKFNSIKTISKTKPDQKITALRLLLNHLYLKKNPREKYNYFNLLIDQFYRKKNADSIIYYGEMNLKYALNANLKVDTYNNLANIYYIKQNYKKSSYYMEKGFALADSITDMKIKEDLFINMAKINRRLNYFNRAKKYYEKALEISKKRDKEGFERARIYSGLGRYYDKVKDYSNSITYMKKALFLAKKHNNKYLQTVYHDDIGGVYIKEKKYNYALNHLEKSLAIKKNIYTQKKLSYELSYTYSRLGKLYYKTNPPKFNKAVYYLKKAEQEFKKKNDFIQLQSVQLSLFNAYQLQKDTKNASDYFRKYIKLNDSTNRDYRNNAVIEIETKYQTEKKEKENLALKNQAIEQNLIITQKEKKATLLYSALGGALLLLLGGVFISKQQQKNQRKTLIIEKLEAKEYERNRLSGNVHDSLAGYLRNALTKVDNINKELKNKQLNEVGDAIELALNKARNISQEFQKLDFNKMSFKNHVTSLFVERETLYSITINQTAIDSINWEIVSPEIKTEFYRILQEALLNTHKHANANNVMVTFSQNKNTVHMQIEDDGIGTTITKSFESVGLKNMKSRVDDLDGQLIVNSEPNNGFILNVAIPIT